MAEESSIPERPRAEPEIIPPDRTASETGWHRRSWRLDVSGQPGQTHRIYVARIGPLWLALLMLVAGICIAVILLAMLGAVLLWIPLLALALAAGAVIRLLRR